MKWITALSDECVILKKKRGLMYVSCMFIYDVMNQQWYSLAPGSCLLWSVFLILMHWMHKRDVLHRFMTSVSVIVMWIHFSYLWIKYGET